jgi:hypothetical protein
MGEGASVKSVGFCFAHAIVLQLPWVAPSAVPTYTTWRM